MNDDEAFQLLPDRGLPPPSALRVVGSTIVVLAIPTGAGVLFYYERGIWTGSEAAAILLATLFVHAVGAVTYLAYGRTGDSTIIWNVLARRFAACPPDEEVPDPQALGALFERTAAMQQRGPSDAAGVVIDFGWFLAGATLSPILANLLS